MYYETYLDKITKEQFDMIVAEAKKNNVEFDGGVHFNGCYQMTIVADRIEDIYDATEEVFSKKYIANRTKEVAA